MASVQTSLNGLQGGGGDERVTCAGSSGKQSKPFERGENGLRPLLACGASW